MNLNRMKCKKNDFCTFLLLCGLILFTQPLLTFSQESKIDAKDETGLTVLMQAAQDGDAKEITDLLARRANLEIKNQYGWTALMYAVAAQDASKIKILLENSADVNTTDNRGFTPLMLAALGDKTEIVELLLSKGANINAVNRKGFAALSYAKGKGNNKIGELLEKSGGTGNVIDKADVPEKIAPIDQLPKPLNLKEARPRYTDEARDRNISGSVRMRVLFGTDGKIKKIKIIEGLPYGLTEEATKAVSKLKVNPAMHEGKPVEYWSVIQMSFRIG